MFPATISTFAWLAAEGAITAHALPFQTLITCELVLKYNAPTINELESLSVAGADPFAPKYRSSNESYEAAALVAEDAAAVAELAPAVALLDALVA
jgi:hypothetical protein